MKDVLINLRVNEQFKSDLQKLATTKKYNGVSEMIRREYAMQIEGLNNMVNNQEYVLDFLPVASKLMDNVNSDDELTNELIKFCFEYMLTNQEAMTSLFNKYMLMKLK